MLRVGIVGCGSIFTMHATSVDHLENATLVGVCDIKKDRADKAAAKYNVPAYYDYKELIDNGNLDVVHVCVPHYMHPVISRYALEHGVNVLCEKPMSIDYASGEANVKLAEEKNLRYGIIFQCRYNNTSRLIKENLDNGKLGKLISARCTLTWCKPDSYYSLSDWKGTWDKEGGGVIIDQAIHSLDLANWFINSEPVEVQASIANRAHDIMKVDDTGEGFIRYKNGATMAFWAMNNYGCDDPIEIRLCCENGRAVMSYDDARIEFNDGTVLSTAQQADGIYYEGGKDYWGFQHIRQIADFYHSVEEGTEPFISGKEALKIQKVICAIYESAKTGKTITF
ncbi:MAG: Gfo/Idh/MocA family oxidoreductase [Clostridia bacterium]|nr:Gfo/Idh/MocA family oxidoreductase [Clostridia bacterium]MBQ5901323.1 Gfo/Idh/MocA family oxidoreductase [Clostridia bacterium]